MILVTLLISTPSWSKLDMDIGISTHAGWFGQGSADREAQVIVDTVENKVGSIEMFSPGNQDELADWVKENTGDKQIDMLLLCGQFPNTIYKPGNAEPNGSIAEEFLEDGNLIANTGDYMFYVVDGAGTNAAGGLQNMMDIPGITMWDDDTPVKVTADGEKYLPSLKDFVTDRPFHLNELTGDWETEVIFAGNDGEDSTRAEPVVVHNTKDDGRLAIFYQTAGQDADPRGVIISEFILNWLPTIVGGAAIEPAEKLTTTWGMIKSN
jgi:hypothetical protein